MFQVTYLLCRTATDTSKENMRNLQEYLCGTNGLKITTDTTMNVRTDSRARYDWSRGRRRGDRVHHPWTRVHQMDIRESEIKCKHEVRLRRKKTSSTVPRPTRSASVPEFTRSATEQLRPTRSAIVQKSTRSATQPRPTRSATEQLRPGHQICNSTKIYHISNATKTHQICNGTIKN